MVTRRQFLAGSIATAASLTACGSDSGSSNDSSGPYQFTYLRPVWGPATFTKGGPYQKELEKGGNVKINPQIIPVADYNDKVNARLAAGDIPEVIWGVGPIAGPSGHPWRDATEQGAFLPIDEYLDEFTAVRDAVPQNIWDSMKDPDGSTYFLPNLIWPEVPFFPYYRKDLFDRANISEPTDVDSFVDALRAVQSAYPKLIPLAMPDEWYTKELATSFGFVKNGWEPSPDDPDTLNPWFVKQSEIDFYMWLQGLHKEGLLDPGFRVDDPNAAFDKFKGGKAAVVLAHWNEFPNYLGELRKVEKSAEIGVMPPLGEGAGNRQVFPVDRGMYLSAKIEAPERFFEFLEWTLTEGEGYDLRRYGVEGEMYEVSGDEKIGIPEPERDKNYQLSQVEPLGFIGPFDEKLDWDQTQKNYEAAGFDDLFDYVKGRFDEYTATYRSDVRIPTVASETEDDIGAQLEADFVIPLMEGAVIDHGISKDGWLDQMDKWRSGGGDDIIAEVSEAQEDRSEPDFTQA